MSDRIPHSRHRTRQIGSVARAAGPRWSGLVYPVLLLTLLLLLCACATPEETATPPSGRPLPPGRLSEGSQSQQVVSSLPTVDSTLTAADVDVAPLPLRAGFPFTITAPIQNNLGVPAVDVPLMVHISAGQEQIGYAPFFQVLTLTLPASQTVPVEIPVNANLAGGEHQLWIQVNRLAEATRIRAQTLPEEETGDNLALVDLMVDPFDAYTSGLCPGRVDVELSPTGVSPDPESQRVMVRVHNIGNRAVYNLPVVVLGEGQTSETPAGITYTPAIPPCGGTADVQVQMDHPFDESEVLKVQVNPRDWTGGLVEEDYDNNEVTVSAGLTPGLVAPPGSLEDYDFSISTADIESPETWIVLVTVHNLGTRDADKVPIRIENESGRKLTDAIPLVQGNGVGVAAFRVGYLWLRGGTLTFTLNPPGAEGAYAETNRENNVATFTLP